MRWLRRIAAATAMILAAGTLPALAQPPEGRPRGGGLGFSADAASFLDATTGEPRVELYVAIPLTSLHFVQREGRAPTTGVDITAIFYDRDGRQATGDDWNYPDIPGSLSHEENEGRQLTRRYVFRLPPGEYRASVRVEEVGTGVRGHLELPVTVPDFDKGDLSASDPVFGICPEMIVSAPKSDYVGPILPHPSHVYGDDVPRVCVWWELYDRLAGEGDAYAVRFRVKDESGQTREDSTLAVPRSGGRGTVLLSPRLTGLTLGRFTLELEATLGPAKVRRDGEFIVDETRISFIQDADKLRTVLGYIASNEEIRLLEDTPDDSLAAFWKRFWDRRDPSRDDRANEAMLEFLRRVDYATRNFGVLEPGWRSDMGRIYIRYGAPDNIERVLNDPYRPPTEIWYYYSRNATYVFQDADGFGRYRLVGTRRD